MKKLLVFLSAVLLSFTMALTAFADPNVPSADPSDKVVDNADLLTDEQEDKLETKINGIIAKYSFDIVIVTTDSCEGKTVTEFADDFYDYNGYGIGSSKDGMLFLLSMEDRDWYISTTGKGITAFTDYGISYIGDKIVESLSAGNYYNAFDEYLDYADQFLGDAEAGAPFDIDTDESYEEADSSDSKSGLLAILGVSVAIAGSVVGGASRGMNTARKKTNARDYVEKNSFKLREKKDIFLYSHIDRERKPEKDNSSSGGSSTHTGSSGTTHGGGGGKF